MTDHDLNEVRREKWRLNGNPLRTLDEARSFIESVGFCLMYPVRPPVLAPTFIGAWAGSDEHLPAWQQAFADPRAEGATALMVRLLREHLAYEANVYGENNSLLIAASVFPYVYALVGERNPRQAPKLGDHSGYSELACDCYAAIERGGPISKQKLIATLGKGISVAGVDKSLAELWSKLRITRVDYDPREGSVWDLLYRWAPDAVREGIELSIPAALSALISKYLDCVVAADQSELDNFFSYFAPRSRVKEAVNVLLTAREFEFIRIGKRSLIQIVPRKVMPRPAGEAAG